MLKVRETCTLGCPLVRRLAGIKEMKVKTITMANFMIWVVRLIWGIKRLLFSIYLYLLLCQLKVELFYPWNGYNLWRRSTKNDHTPDNKSLIMNSAILDAVLLFKCCNFVFYICVKKLNLPNNNIWCRFNNKLITI